VSVFTHIGSIADARPETAAQNTAMFMVSRAIIGVGITPAIVGASSLISGGFDSSRSILFQADINQSLPIPRSERDWALYSMLSSLPVSEIISSRRDLLRLGSALAAIVTIGTFRMASEWAWRVPSLVQVLPALISFCFIFLIRKCHT